MYIDLRIDKLCSLNVLCRMNDVGVLRCGLIEKRLYQLFTSDLPQPEGTTVATFADDTVIMAVGGDTVDATEKLQRTADEINNST